MIILGLACVATVPSLPTDSSDSGEPVDSAGDSGETGETGGVGYDCDDPWDFSESFDVLSHARGWHGLAMEGDKLLGWDQSAGALVKADYEGERDTFVPGIGSAEQMVLRDNGDLFFVDSAGGAVIRVTPEGGQERLTGGLYAGYGIVWGPDGKLWVSDGNVLKVDPDSGEMETVLEMPADETWMAHAVDFSLDSTMLYVGTVPYGDLLQVELDAELNPVGEPERLAKMPGHWIDAVSVDACGDIWIAEFGQLSLYRVSPRGDRDEMVEGGRSRYYGHGITWGNGVDGWRSDAIYQPLPYNGSKVLEVVIGVGDGAPLRTWNGSPVE